MIEITLSLPVAPDSLVYAAQCLRACVRMLAHSQGAASFDACARAVEDAAGMVDGEFFFFGCDDPQVAAAKATISESTGQIKNWSASRPKSTESPFDAGWLAAISGAVEAIELSGQAGRADLMHLGGGDTSKKLGRALPKSKRDLEWLARLSENWRGKRLTLPALAREFIGKNASERAIKKETVRLKKTAERYSHAWKNGAMG